MMRAALAAASCLLATSVAFAEDSAEAAFEGAWGFVSSNPQDAWFGDGFRDGQGVCGGPKQLEIDIREEQGADGSHERTFRYHRDQPIGARITSLANRRLTAEFLGEADDLILRADGALIIQRGTTTLLFKRC